MQVEQLGQANPTSIGYSSLFVGFYGGKPSFCVTTFDSS